MPGDQAKRFGGTGAAIVAVLIASLTAVGFSLGLVVVNDALFLEGDQKRQVTEFLHSQSSTSYLSEKTTINIGSTWPWYSYLFYYGVMSVFWFSVGKKMTTHVNHEVRLWPLAVPLIHTMLFQDIMSPLYFLCCYLGISMHHGDA